ncbi:MULTISPECIES: DUF5663 domain-containing protein [unclassified Nocardioides]|uniref:DUF5663 domain-containing protein n=1 Tax=unclassified Nocardioides TaxID=2615069 RepID=UPI00059FF46C|nr:MULTISPECIES: DUF5663 domain-containing protein [unclassified Nocardioides]
MITPQADLVDILGDDSDPHVIRRLAAGMLERLQLRVGNHLAGLLSDPELTAFESLIDAEADDETCQEFLAQHIPQYEQVVRDEWDGLLAWFADEIGRPAGLEGTVRGACTASAGQPNSTGTP